MKKNYDLLWRSLKLDYVSQDYVIHPRRMILNGMSFQIKL